MSLSSSVLAELRLWNLRDSIQCGQHEIKVLTLKVRYGSMLRHFWETLTSKWRQKAQHDFVNNIVHNDEIGPSPKLVSDVALPYRQWKQNSLTVTSGTATQVVKYDAPKVRFWKLHCSLNLFGFITHSYPNTFYWFVIFVKFGVQNILRFVVRLS